MSRLTPIAERRTGINRYPETGVKRAADRSLARETSILDRRPDLWGSWLAALLENSITDTSITDAVVSASAAIELLRNFVIGVFDPANEFLSYGNNF